MSGTPQDPIAILIEHNRRALTLLLGAARNLPKGDLHRVFGLGLGTFPDAIVACFGSMVYWSDQINSAAPRRQLVLTDADGHVLASEVRSVHALQTMLQAVADEFEVTVARARPRLAEAREWTLADDSVWRATVAEVILHTLSDCAAHRERALLVLMYLGVQPLPDIRLIPALQAAPQHSASPQDHTKVSS